jgi:hypothetical protein
MAIYSSHLLWSVEFGPFGGVEVFFQDTPLGSFGVDELSIA